MFDFDDRDETMAERILAWRLLERWLTRMPFRPAMQIVTADLELHAWQWRELEQWAH